MSTKPTGTPSVAPDDLGRKLLHIARASISTALGQPAWAPDDDARLQAPGASFVTLTQRGGLRGCIGSLEPQRSLLEDVKANAVAAALHDRRFLPLRLDELAHTDIEVSVLSPMQAMHFDSEADALEQLRPGVDGVVFMHGTHRSTFLPQVWEQLRTPKAFMAQLKCKAGMPADFWSEDVRLQRYTVQKWQEPQGGVL